jgi:hypothetical protein
LLAAKEPQCNSLVIHYKRYHEPNYGYGITFTISSESFIAFSICILFNATADCGCYGACHYTVQVPSAACPAGGGGDALSTVLLLHLQLIKA